MKTVSIAAGATPTIVVPPRPRWSILIQNKSDTTIVLKIDGDDDILDVDQGFDLDAGGALLLEDFAGAGVYDHAIEAVHAAGTAKLLRVQEIFK